MFSYVVWVSFSNLLFDSILRQFSLTRLMMRETKAPMKMTVSTGILVYAWGIHDVSIAKLCLLAPISNGFEPSTVQCIHRNCKITTKPFHRFVGWKKKKMYWHTNWRLNNKSESSIRRSLCCLGWRKMPRRCFTNRLTKRFNYWRVKNFQQKRQPEALRCLHDDVEITFQ